MKYWHCVNEHEHCEDHEMKSCKGFGQPFIITCETAETVEPAKAALDHPLPGLQYEAPFRFLQFNHLKFNTFIERGLPPASDYLSCYLILRDMVQGR